MTRTELPLEAFGIGKGRMNQTRTALTVLSSPKLEQLSVKDRQLAQVISCFVHFDAVTGLRRPWE